MNLGDLLCDVRFKPSAHGAGVGAGAGADFSPHTKHIDCTDGAEAGADAAAAEKSLRQLLVRRALGLKAA